MNRFNNFFLTGMSYVLGELKNLEDLRQLNVDDRQLLLSLGLRQYSESTQKSVEMARQSCLQTLSSVPVEPDQIDALVYTGDICQGASGEKTLGWLLEEVNLDHAYPVGVSLFGCANFIHAARIARSLLFSENFKNVLLVTSYKSTSPMSRIMSSSLSILSDAAASCLISSAVGEGPGHTYEILGIYLLTDGSLWNTSSSSNFSAYLRGRTAGIRRTLSGALDGLSLQVQDVRKFITNNYNLSVIRLFADLAGFEREQLYYENVGRFAHAYSCDNLINLYDCTESGIIGLQDVVLLLGTGDINWGAMIVRKRR